MKEQYANAGPASGASGLEGQTVINVGDNAELKPFLGRKLGDIAQETGSSAVAVMLDLGVKSALKLQLKSPPISATSPEQALAYLAHPNVIGGGSDGGAHTKAFGMGPLRD